MKSLSKAAAFPGLPVVFAEGYGVYSCRRISLHDSVGLALTGEKEKIRTETTVTASDSDTTLVVDGRKPSGARARGMNRLIEELSAKASHKGNLKIESQNKGILSGSSDSGAAALVVALNDFLGFGLSRDELLLYGIFGSETVFRSLYGGLTEYVVLGDGVSVLPLASREELSDVVVFGVSFEGERFAADEIHSFVVKHPSYPSRRKQARERIVALKRRLSEGDLNGVFEVMESDARQVHGLFSDVGKKVINADMKKLCDSVESWRRDGLKAFWNVAGGRQVYVFCLKQEKSDVAELLGGEGLEYKLLKVAGPARII